MILFLLAGCASPDPAGAPVHTGSPDSSTADLPEEIRGLDNLTVYSPHQTPQYEIRLVREHSYRRPEEFQMFYDNSKIAVDDDNNVYIFAGLKVFAYRPDGSFIDSLGGRGRGPGELQAFETYDMKLRSDSLFLLDTGLRRINIYSLSTMEPLDAILLDPDAWNGIDSLRGKFLGLPSVRADHFYPLPGKRLLVRFSASPSMQQIGIIGKEVGGYSSFLSRSLFYQMDTEGNITSDKIFGVNNIMQLADGGIKITPEPFTRRTRMAVNEDGEIYTAWTEDFLIRRYDADGTYRHAFYHPVPKQPIDRKAYIDSASNGHHILLERYQNTDFPKTWPVLNHMMVDDEDRIWVAVYTDRSDEYSWWVLNREGELLAKFRWPGIRMETEQRGIRFVRNNHLYAYEESDSDEEYGGWFVRYRIELSPRNTDGQ